MRRKLRTVLALLMAILVLAGCGRPSVEAARAAVPRAPAPHVPPRPPGHLPRWEPYRPPRPQVPVVPHDGALSFEASVELRVRDLRERYEQVSELIPYACKAKDIWDMSKAESIEDAAEQFVLSVGGSLTLVPSVVRLVHDMETQSATDRVGEVAVFTLCRAVG
jgi:hypothetical protein